jgi:2,3-bisphosphoglycerate-dependent phosphoglycerate mutase
LDTISDTMQAGTVQAGLNTANGTQVAFQRPFGFFFVRHGVTELNFRGLRCGGDLDVPLTDLGCDQAYLLAKQIQRMDLQLDRILCGSLIRVRQTALIISGVLGGLPIEIDPLLNERRIGDWNRRSIAETEELIASKIAPVGGESEEEFTDRIRTALIHLSTHSDHRPLVVSSKGVGRILNTLLGGEGRMQVANGEIVEFHVAVNKDGSPKLDVRRPSFV